MIGSLRGRVLALDDKGLLVEVGGVGYRVQAPSGAMAALEVGSEVFLHVHTHVREDALVLFGFLDHPSLVAFEALIGAHGVGPSLALGVLSVYSAAQLGEIISKGDVAALRAVPGVGAKTAARMLLDLENRLGGLSGADLGPEGGLLGEVRQALEALGYSAEEARKATAGLAVGTSLEEMLRAALRELSAAS